jgi:hypothetical protein
MQTHAGVDVLAAKYACMCGAPRLYKYVYAYMFKHCAPRWSANFCYSGEKSSSAIFRVKNKHQTGMLWCCFVSSLDSLLHLQMAVLNVRQPSGTGFQNDLAELGINIMIKIQFKIQT